VVRPRRLVEVLTPSLTMLREMKLERETRSNMMPKETRSPRMRGLRSGSQRRRRRKQRRHEASMPSPTTLREMKLRIRREIWSQGEEVKILVQGFLYNVISCEHTTNLLTLRQINTELDSCDKMLWNFLG
jgi:hypothetical protein